MKLADKIKAKKERPKYSRYELKQIRRKMGIDNPKSPFRFIEVSNEND
jgi:hypothetical protein